MTNNITKKRQKKGKTVQVIIIIIDTKNNRMKQTRRGEKAKTGTNNSSN
jgi:hypothetical protein